MTIGNFDGVHRGHQRLIEHLRSQSQRLQLPTMLMTFEPQPREFFAGAVLPARLTRFREKVHLLERTGLDRLLCMPFNDQTSQIPAEWFAEEFLTDLVDARYVVIGDDFRFGHERKGDFQLLQRKTYPVSYAQKLLFDKFNASTTKRERLEENFNFYKIEENFNFHKITQDQVSALLKPNAEGVGIRTVQTKGKF